MADSNLNIIKPVENLQNIAGVTPTRPREQRKRRQNLNEQDEQKTGRQMENPIDEQQGNETGTEERDGQHVIDYCA